MYVVMPDIDFLNILERCKSGDSLAQKQLYKEHFGWGMALCMRYSKSREDALEIYNNAWLKIFSNLDQFKPSFSFVAWVK